MKLQAFILLSLVLSVPKTGQSVPPATQPIEHIATADLIERLLDIDDKTFAVRTNIIALGEGSELPPGMLKRQDADPPLSAAMQELIGRGVESVPQLLAHLSDSRPTKATVRGIVGGVIYAAEFDRNRSTHPENPPGVVEDWSGQDSRRLEGPLDYQVTIGDVCFNILGVIVNRKYAAARYVPSAIIIVNSMSMCPELASAARNEWAGLTVEQHRASLISDVSRPDHAGRDIEGLVALWRYYPQALAPAVRQRLALPEYDRQFVHAFAEEQLYFNSVRRNGSA